MILTDSKNLDYLQIGIFKVNPQKDRNIFVPTVFYLSKQNMSQLIHQRFVDVSISILKRMAIKHLLGGLLKNLPDLEEPCLICILTKATKIPRSGMEYWIGSCFPSVVFCVRISRLTATQFSANREITTTFFAKSVRLAEGERCC